MQAALNRIKSKIEAQTTQNVERGLTSPSENSRRHALDIEAHLNMRQQAMIMMQSQGIAQSQDASQGVGYGMQYTG